MGRDSALVIPQIDAAQEVSLCSAGFRAPRKMPVTLEALIKVHVIACVGLAQWSREGRFSRPL